MAKERKMEQMEKQEMTQEEAKAFRASLAKPEDKKLTEQQKREEFRVFWAKSKKKYGKAKDLETILWVHLKAIKMDDPTKFEDGLKHFGLKRIK
jgi:hypothetical protein